MSVYATTTPQNDLAWAQAQYADNMRRRMMYLAWCYYDGDHRLAFATEKFRTTFGNLFKEFAENACPAVVDSLVDRLKVTGYRTSAATTQTQDVPNTAAATAPGMPPLPPRKKVKIEDPKSQEVWDIWTRNRMDAGSKEVHEEASKTGNSYVIVWPNDQMEAEIFPQLGDECGIQFDPNNKKIVLRGCKRWFNAVDKHWYLNIYNQEGIYKFRSRQTPHHAPDNENGWAQIDEIDNPYSKVPMFHFPRAKASGSYGKSDLTNVIPLQDGLNKSVMDLLIAMEFASFKQRYVIGMDVEIDPESGQPTDANAKDYGVDRMMAIPDPEAKVGQFDSTDLQQFLHVQEKFWASIARVSGTPLHYFFITQGDFPSGEAQKAAEARFATRIEDCQTVWGNVWEDVMSFAMEIDGKLDDSLELTAMWSNAQPRSDAELADTAVKKRAIGFSRSYLIREFGVPEDEIDMMLEESDAEAVQRAALAQPPVQNDATPPGDRSTSKSTAQPSGENTKGVRQ